MTTTTTAPRPYVSGYCACGAPVSPAVIASEALWACEECARKIWEAKQPVTRRRKRAA